MVKTLAIHSSIHTLTTPTVIHGSTNMETAVCAECSCQGGTEELLKSRRPAGDLFELHWLPVQSRTSFKMACLTCKILSQPVYMRALLHHDTPHRTFFTLLYAQSTNTLGNLGLPFGKRAFSYLTTKTWNSFFPLHSKPSHSPIWLNNFDDHPH